MTLDSDFRVSALARLLKLVGVVISSRYEHMKAGGGKMVDDRDISERDLLLPGEMERLYNNLREYTVHEDTLVNHRLTLLLYIQGFLFAAYGLTVQQMFVTVGKAVDEPAEIAAVLLYYVYALFAFGGIVCASSIAFIFQVWRSVTAATTALAGIRTIWTIQHKAYQEAGGPKYLKPPSRIRLEDTFFSPIYGIYPYIHGGGHRIPSKDRANRKRRGLFPFQRNFKGKRAVSVKRVDAPYLGFVAAQTIPLIFLLAWSTIFLMHLAGLTYVSFGGLPHQKALPAEKPQPQVISVSLTLDKATIKQLVGQPRQQEVKANGIAKK